MHIRSSIFPKFMVNLNNESYHSPIGFLTRNMLLAKRKRIVVSLHVQCKFEFLLLKQYDMRNK